MLHYFVLNSSWIILSVVLLGAFICCIRDRGRELHPFNKQNTLGLRGLMAILIIFCHTAHEFSESTPIGFFIDFGAPIVGMFLFLSGYGLVKSFEKSSVKFMHKFIPRNLMKLLPVLITATIVSIALRWGFLGDSPIAALQGYLHGEPPLEFSWFMYLLLALYMLFYFTFLNVKQPLMSVIVLFGLTAVLYVCFRALDWGVYWYLSVFAFNAGNFVALFENQISRLVRKHKGIIILGVLTLIAVCGVLGIRNGIIFWCFGLYLLIVVFGGLDGKIWTILGNYAYEIYLAHGICLPLIQPLSFGCAITLCLNVVSSVILAIPLKMIADIFISNRYSTLTTRG